ncbi:site-specific recombinase, phage integrase family protein [Pseudomonas sp. CF150]|nr:site-specific recombinase, phage integrase family protein [Pseudomonas sp. CF150]
MISLFEELGARRAEVQSITVASVISAAKVERPMITINTLKQGRTGVTRAIELSPALVDELINYIRGERRLVMKRFKDISDHGFLFVTERGGRPLGIDTITTEFSIIRRAAGIEEQACAHLFRHAFCTNIAAQLIAETQALSPESFRQTLLTNKMLAERALSMSGHAVLESFLQYVDNAFKIKSKYEQIVHNVQFARTYEAYEKRRKRLLEALKKDRISKVKFIEREEFLSKTMQRALENADQPFR